MVLSPAASVTVHRLPATPSTVHWGYFDPRLETVLTVAPGDLVTIETLTHHAGDAPDLLMDAGVREVFHRVTDRGLGPHLLTGPIAVDGARPGDVPLRPHFGTTGVAPAAPQRVSSVPPGDHGGNVDN